MLRRKDARRLSETDDEADLMTDLDEELIEQLLNEDVILP